MRRGRQLTRPVRRKPYSVVLFDEVEKAHPDVFNILLQVLDDGPDHRSQGRTVDFKNTILILTSNLGSQYLLEGINADGRSPRRPGTRWTICSSAPSGRSSSTGWTRSSTTSPSPRRTSPPSWTFSWAALNRRLAHKQLKVELTPAAKTYVIDNGYDPLYGARPLRRFLQHTVETLVSRKLIADEVLPDTTLVVDCQGDQLVVR